MLYEEFTELPGGLFIDIAQASGNSAIRSDRNHMPGVSIRRRNVTTVGSQVGFGDRTLGGIDCAAESLHFGKEPLVLAGIDDCILQACRCRLLCRGQNHEVGIGAAGSRSSSFDPFRHCFP
jgi:hypothetical protein